MLDTGLHDPLPARLAQTVVSCLIPEAGRSTASIKTVADAPQVGSFVPFTRRGRCGTTKPMQTVSRMHFVRPMKSISAAGILLLLNAIFVFGESTPNAAD